MNIDESPRGESIHHRDGSSETVEEGTRKMNAASEGGFGLPPNTDQRGVSVLGWGIAFAIGSAIWVLLYVLFW
jgi:hypothetical protein